MMSKYNVMTFMTDKVKLVTRTSKFTIELITTCAIIISMNVAKKYYYYLLQVVCHRKQARLIFTGQSNPVSISYLTVYANCMIMLLLNYVKIIFLPVKCNLVSKRTTLPRCAQ